MTLLKRSFIWVLLVMMISAPSFSKPRADKVLLYTTWDSDFFYAAFDVSDPDIQGNATAPNQPVGDDDAVAVYFQVDRTTPATINENTYRMIVSAAGGCEFAVGDNGEWVTKQITTFKYAVRVDGIINDDQNDDVGYQVEIAVPWKELGITADLGTAVRFNATVQMKGEHTGFISLAPGIETEEDRRNPSKWPELWLRGPVQPLLVHTEGRILCNRIIMRPPVIDGRIQSVEYPERTALVMEKPSIAMAHRVFRDIPVQRLIYATYYFDLPGGNPQDHSHLAHRPYGGIGPWTSSESAAWHRRQLKDALQAGIDVLLPVLTSPDETSPAAPHSLLKPFAAAIAEIAAAGDDHPRVGLFVSEHIAAGLQTAPNKVDALWATIRNFYTQIPVVAWAQVRLPESRGGHTALPVFIANSISLTEQDRNQLNQLADAEFGNSLIIVLQPGASGGDAYLPNARNAEGWAIDDNGWISMAAISPGFVSENAVLSRNDGATFNRNWSVVTEQDSDWVLIDSFNGLHNASEIAPTSEFGLLYTDASAVQTIYFTGDREFSAKFLSASVPEIISPEYISTARISVRNVGLRGWRVADRIRLGYRWYTGGRLYSQGVVQLPLQMDIGINRIGDLSIGIAAVDTDRDPLPEGDWLLVFDLIRPDGRTFSSGGDNPLAVPVKVGTPPAFAYSILNVSVPSVLMSGQTQKGTVTLRNDGSEVWKAGGPVNVVLNASRVGTEDQQASLAVWRAALTSDVPPGRIVDIPVNLTMRDDAGRAIIPSSTDENSFIRIAASLTGGNAGSGPSMTATASLQTLERAYTLKLPEQPPVGHEYGRSIKFPIEVTNEGPVSWSDHKRLVARWYSLDGHLLVNNGGGSRVNRGMNPGDTRTVEVELHSPPYPGQYVVKWELVPEGETSPQSFASNSGSMATQYVTVKGPALVFLDLEPLRSVDVISSESEDIGEGFDGQGRAFADHLLPPLVVPNPAPSPVYPAGLFTGSTPGGSSFNGVESWRWIGFSWPSKAPEQSNAVAASGQTVPIDSITANRVHVLAASSDGPRQAQFMLNYGASQRPATAIVGDWNQPGSGDNVAFRTAYRLGPDGIEPHPAYLYTVTLNADVSTALTGITLPNDPAIKILAITLEKAPAQ